MSMTLTQRKTPPKKQACMETAMKSKAMKQKAPQPEPEPELEKKKREVKNSSRGIRRKIPCPQCQKPLSKARKMLEDHYKSFHKWIPNNQCNEEVSTATARVMPVRKDGTCSTDKDAVQDMCRCQKVCKFCIKPWSVSHMRRDHLNLDSHIRCAKIPMEDLAPLRTGEEKKKWTSDTLRTCENAVLNENKFQKVYAGASYFTTDELIKKVYNHMKSYHGKLHITSEI